MSEFTNKFKKEQGERFTDNIIRKYGHTLPTYYPEYFTEWWNKDKFNYYYCGCLAQYCSEYFDIWWDPYKINWKWDSHNLAKYCSVHFKKWWNPKNFNWGERGMLIENCFEYILTWYDPEKIDICDLDPKSIVYLKRHGRSFISIKHDKIIL